MKQEKGMKDDKRAAQHIQVRKEFNVNVAKCCVDNRRTRQA
jgi:hypothetical protein